MRELARFASVSLGLLHCLQMRRRLFRWNWPRVVEHATTTAQAGGGGPYKAAMFQYERLLPSA